MSKEEAKPEPTIQERIYSVSPERREWVIRFRTAALQYIHNLEQSGDFKLGAPPGMSYLEFFKRIKNANKDGSLDMLERFLFETMTDGERAEYAEGLRNMVEKRAPNRWARLTTIFRRGQRKT